MTPALIYVSGFLADIRARSSGQRLAAMKLKQLSEAAEGPTAAFCFLNAMDRRGLTSLPDTGVTVIDVRAQHRMLGALRYPLLPIHAATRALLGRRRLRSLLETAPDAAVYADFIQGLAAVPPEAWSRCVLRQHDIVSVMYERRAELSRGAAKAFFTLEAARARQFERASWSKVRRLVVLTENDADFIRAQTGREVEVETPPPTFDLTNVLARRNVGELSPRILFWGNMSRIENIDAVQYFHSEIWPKVVASRPDAVAVIAGADPPTSISKLASDSVVVTGYLDDPADVFAEAAVAIAPIRIGAGIKMKVVETVSAGIPTVATSVGAEGIHHPLLTVADDPQVFADEVIRVLAHHQ